MRLDVADTWTLVVGEGRTSSLEGWSWSQVWGRHAPWSRWGWNARDWSPLVSASSAEIVGQHFETFSSVPEGPEVME